jgi:hypothetical protein
LLGADDVRASRQFYVDRGLAVARSFGRKYVGFDTPSSPIKLALYRRRALTKDAGVSPDGTGAHRLVLGSDAGPFTDPDGSCARPRRGDSIRVAPSMRPPFQGDPSRGVRAGWAAGQVAALLRAGLDCGADQVEIRH